MMSVIRSLSGISGHNADMAKTVRMTHSRPSLEVTSLWLRGLDQMLAEKRNYIGVKLLVEANAIKAWRVAT
jgi:hypothetical protein